MKGAPLAAEGPLFRGKICSFACNYDRFPYVCLWDRSRVRPRFSGEEGDLYARWSSGYRTSMRKPLRATGPHDLIWVLAFSLRIGKLGVNRPVIFARRVAGTESGEPLPSVWKGKELTFFGR